MIIFYLYFNTKKKIYVVNIIGNCYAECKTIVNENNSHFKT